MIYKHYHRNLLIIVSLILTACTVPTNILAETEAAVATPIPTSAFAPETPTAEPAEIIEASADEEFLYTVRVVDSERNQPIVNASVSVDLAGQTPKRSVTGSDGFAAILISSGFAGQLGSLSVNMDGYTSYRINITLEKDVLPEVIPMISEQANAEFRTRYTLVGNTPDTIIPLAHSPYSTTLTMSADLIVLLPAILSGAEIDPAEIFSKVFADQTIVTSGTEVRLIEGSTPVPLTEGIQQIEGLGPASDMLPVLFEIFPPLVHVEILSGSYKGQQGWVLEYFIQEEIVPITNEQR